MITNLLIGLREGLEASLVVGILLAYVSRSGRRSRLAALWVGVGAAVAVSAAFGSLLYLTAHEVADRAEPVLAGSLGLVAVAFVTYMIFWMRRTARSLRSQLENRVDDAVRVGWLALALAAFVAVAREGLETALFLWTNIQTSTGSTALPLIGALAGLLAAVGLEYLIYRSAVRIDLGRFFRITGVLLIVVIAGVLAGSIGDLQEVGLLPGANAFAFDVSAAVPEASWYGTLLSGIVGFHPETTWLMLTAWVLYLIPMVVLFLRPFKLSAPSSRRAADGTATAAG